MKKIVCLILLLATSVSFSQEAKALLDEVANKVRSYENMYIEFEHKIDNEEANVHQLTNGKATLQGDLYRFEYMGVEQLFDGNKVYLMVHEDEEIVIKQPNTEDVTTLTPSKMMTFYEKGFDYEMDIVQNVKGKKMQLVKLTPQNENAELDYVLVAIEVSTKHIHKVIEIGLDGTKTTYTITKFSTNQSIADSFFSFDRVGFEEKGYYITEPK